MLMLKDMKNTRQQGEIGIGYAISYFLEQGWGVSIPLTDSQDYDLIIEIENNLYKVQVKTTYCVGKSGRYQASLKSTHSNTKRAKIIRLSERIIDYIFVLTESGDRYFIPRIAITSETCIVLGDKWKEYKV
jgi:hypothetical protein